MAMVNPYYVGTTLTDIGNNMSRDRAVEAQQAIAQQQARAQQAAMIQQAMLQRAQMAQQGQQFGQELALRQAQQQEANKYQQMLMALKERELQHQMSGFTPRDVADNQFRYDQLANQLKLAEINTRAQDPRLQVERERQIALNQRDLNAAQEAWDYNEASAKTKVSQYNTLIDQLEAQAKELEAKKQVGWDDPQSRKAVADKYRKDKYNEILMMLQSDKRPGDIAPNPVTKKFEPVLPPRPGGARVDTRVNNPQLSNNPVGFQVPNDPNQLADRPIKVRTSDGTIWNTTASKFSEFKRRDPGAVMYNPTAVPQTGGASDSWEVTQQPAQAPLLHSLYGYGPR